MRFSVLGLIIPILDQARWQAIAPLTGNSTLIALGRPGGCASARTSASKPNSFWLRSTVVFTEGFDTADLQEAKALLEELS
jgi:hypothetical protein